MEIIPITALKDNYIWAIIDSQKKSALVVDPGEAKPVIDFLKQQQLTLVGILITHHHWDHTNGITELKEKFNIPVIGSAKENVSGVTKSVKEPDMIDLNNKIFYVLDIPGHTLGHIAYYGLNSIFCGDTLFSAGCGRLFEGTPEQMYMTLQKMAALPDVTKIYCGHEYTQNNLRFSLTVEPSNQDSIERLKFVNELRSQHLPTLPSTLKIEKLTNPFLRCDSSELIENVEKFTKKKLSHPIEVFQWLRKWKDEF
ncbi:MAG: Hydroxyacylglutathione hydrolase [uncultured bacterium]|nr:MAG: Hydroxyacylglutathione hydrolase [uncultured bacterium]